MDYDDMVFELGQVLIAPQKNYAIDGRLVPWDEYYVHLANMASRMLNESQYTWLLGDPASFGRGKQ